MKITAIRPAGRDRAELVLDGVVRGTFPLEVVVGAGLKVGQEVDEARLNRLEAGSALVEAKRAALDLLSYQERRVSELVRRLVKKGFAEGVAQEAVGALAESGLVSDERFAETLVRERTALRPQGRYRMLRELGQKGVDEEVARAAVEEVLEDRGLKETDLAREAATKWRPRPGEEPRKAKARLYAFLARRGFSPDAIRTVLEEQGGEEAEEMWEE